LNIAVDQW